MPEGLGLDLNFTTSIGQLVSGLVGDVSNWIKNIFGGSPSVDTQHIWVPVGKVPIDFNSPTWKTDLMRYFVGVEPYPVADLVVSVERNQLRADPVGTDGIVKAGPMMGQHVVIGNTNTAMAYVPPGGPSSFASTLTTWGPLVLVGVLGVVVLMRGRRA